MTVVLSMGGLVSLMTSSMIAPALGIISHDLHIGVSETNLILSIYILALAFGPLLISPLSEMFGRKWIYLGCHLWYLFWNAVAPVGKIRVLLIVARFLAGLGASVAQAVSISSKLCCDRTDIFSYLHLSWQIYGPLMKEECPTVS
jgi:MFS family permease